MTEFVLTGMLPTAKPEVCQKQTDRDGWWICHHCGSIWSEMVSELGWLPLSCPGRRSALISSTQRKDAAT